MERNHPPNNFFLTPKQINGYKFPLYNSASPPAVGADNTNMSAWNNIYGQSLFVPPQQNQVCLRVFERPVDPDNPGGPQTVKDTNGYYLVHKYDFSFGVEYLTAENPTLVPMRLYIPDFMHPTALKKDDIVWGIWERYTKDSPEDRDDNCFLLSYVQQDGRRVAAAYVFNQTAQTWLASGGGPRTLLFDPRDNDNDIQLITDDDYFEFVVEDMGTGFGAIKVKVEGDYYVHFTAGVRATDNIVCSEPIGTCFDPGFTDPTQESWADCMRNKLAAVFGALPRSIIGNDCFFNFDNHFQLRMTYDLLTNTTIFDSDHPCNQPDQPENLNRPLLTTIVMQGVAHIPENTILIPTLDTHNNSGIGYGGTCEWCKMSVLKVGA